ncbi:MAG: YggT family protein [Coleofasciculaceae cyanobacterium SM2_3_26]|nr:YggT family protein [Coleofasciculaceae cyanobacterium SM2_3_26]
MDWLLLDWLTLTRWGLGIFLGMGILLFLFRIILTWYPQIDTQALPYRWIVAPTEPFLVPTRKLIPPIGGVDITPIVWVGICSLVRELLLGQQGLLVLLSLH